MGEREGEREGERKKEREREREGEQKFCSLLPDHGYHLPGHFEFLMSWRTCSGEPFEDSRSPVTYTVTAVGADEGAVVRGGVVQLLLQWEPLPEDLNLRWCE